tara:strand:- start:30 stop:3125 length:3096 start_codon:yes stop_codon:yes gene_type:complete
VDINTLYRAPESEVVALLLKQLSFSDQERKSIHQKASLLVQKVREAHRSASTVDRLMTKYDLSSKEGIALMALAESLIRVPDQATAYQLIQDKMQGVDFTDALSNTDQLSERTVAKALSWATGFLGDSNNRFLKPLKSTLHTASKPVVAYMAKNLISLLANQFVMGTSIKDAQKRLTQNRSKGYSHSFDMLGEAAHTKQDAARYFQAYLKAIQEIGAAEDNSHPLKSSISIKLSALHPRYEVAKRQRVLTELSATLKALCLAAKTANIDLTIDAEESESLELSLEILEQVALDIDLKSWNGLGLAVQAYQKRATTVLDWLADLAIRSERRFHVRLVKGAYWDSEIKQAQELGLEDYPVFTRKNTTDVSYLVCAQKLLSNKEAFYPQFATHNAHSVAAILELAGPNKDFEFQCLFGMGQALYNQVLTQDYGIPVRIYAPVGIYKDLLPYLVRRLLENGANSSFVNEVANPKITIDSLVKDPLKILEDCAEDEISHPALTKPSHILPGRLNSSGLDITDEKALEPVYKALGNKNWKWVGGPIICGKKIINQAKAVTSPLNNHPIGHVHTASKENLLCALEGAQKAHESWANRPVIERATCLDRLACLLEDNRNELIALCTFEGGKSIPDAISEIREAVDFCRYYAVQARENLANDTLLPGPTGEENKLLLKGRGPFLCISPWNFPLAIFIGQACAALVTGNPVLAKPASQTPLIATKAVELMHKAGIPTDVLHLIQASGRVVGETLLSDPRIAGVCFTGSTETAWHINQVLAARRSAIIPFIAETGGQNAMIVDSTALPEQVVTDVITSAFQSAGQRCSALRLLIVQEDIADKIIEMLKGAMAELTLGDPSKLSTDVGPVIDQSAQKSLLAHIEDLKKIGTEIYSLKSNDPLTKQGSFVSPTAYEIPEISALTKEHFGPILHVKRFKEKELDTVLDDINNLGFGLTFGLHSRIESRVEYVASRIKAGNIYVNRNMIGAVVGVQPFGGQGLSGTGPKAGGPHYLYRFMNEQTISIDTTAQGGNASLMTLSESST